MGNYNKEYRKRENSEEKDYLNTEKSALASENSTRVAKSIRNTTRKGLYQDKTRRKERVSSNLNENTTENKIKRKVFNLTILVIGILSLFALLSVYLLFFYS